MAEITGSGVLIDRVIAKAFATNCWILSQAGSGEGLIVDPGIGDPYLHQALLDRCRELRLRPIAALITHGHLDHMFSIAPLCESQRIPAFVHSDDRALLANPERALTKSTQAMIPREITFTEPDEVVELSDGLSIELAGLSLTIRHAPGHTPGSVVALINGEYLVSGDVLFAGSIGRTDLPLGSLSDMESSLRAKIIPLPDEVIVLPGHGRTTTIGAERRNNSFLRAAMEGRLG